MKMNHPYHPPSAVVPNYVPNSTPTAYVVVAFGALAAAATVPAYYIAGSRAPLKDRLAASWFALCGFLHVTFEGYYIFNRFDIASLNTLYAQLWKEYTLSDSRYLTLDVFTVSAETTTVFVFGPLSLLTLAAIIRRHPARHALQVAICSAHLYSVTLYYLTNWIEGVSYSRPEFLYYWVYYVGFNAPWVFVPLLLLRDSFSEVSRAAEALGAAELENKAR